MTARVVILGTAAECADVLEVLHLAADVRDVEMTEASGGSVIVAAGVTPDVDPPAGDEPAGAHLASR